MDLMGMTEINICWQKLPHNQQLWDRTKDWFEGWSVHAANAVTKPFVRKHDQPGEVVSTTIHRLATKIDSSDRDPTGFGRWIYTRFLGKMG